MLSTLKKNLSVLPIALFALLAVSCSTHTKHPYDADDILDSDNSPQSFQNHPTYSYIPFHSSHHHHHLLLWNITALLAFIAVIITAIPCIYYLKDRYEYRLSAGDHAVTKYDAHKVFYSISALTIFISLTINTSLFDVLGIHPGLYSLLLPIIVIPLSFKAVPLLDTYFHILYVETIFNRKVMHLTYFGYKNIGNVRLYDFDEYDVPQKIVIRVGQAEQGSPTTLTELSRHTREMGWGSYDWDYSLTASTITGTAKNSEY